MELLRDPTRWNLGGLAWRFGLPMAAVWMVLLAIPLSYVNPRTGRTGNLIIALLAGIVYFNLLTIGSVWIAQGKACPLYTPAAAHESRGGIRGQARTRKQTTDEKCFHCETQLDVDR